MVDTDSLNRFGKDRCEDVQSQCATLRRCPYGVERFVDASGCDNCRCYDPCVSQNPQCPANMSCAIMPVTNPQSGQTEYNAVCRELYKRGECPQLSAELSRCSQECINDADCSGSAKCCYNGCGTSCLEPAVENVQTQAPDTYQPGSSVPEIFADTPEVEADEGYFVTLRCIARGNPTPTILWVRGGATLSAQGGRYKFLTDGSLQIVGLVQSDAGEYICVADNGVGEPARKTFIVRVRVPVKTNISMDKTVFAVESDISIPCDVDGYPLPKVIWFKDNQILHPSERILISESSRLTVVRANSNDTGLYRCEAANQYDSSYSEVNISVEGIYVDPRCTDNSFFANCNLVVTGKFCTHKYYSKFCCRSCTLAGQLPSIGPHLAALARRRRALSLVNL